MSYILDALKKSEQQRQAVQPGSVADRLLVNPPEARPKAKNRWIALILGNLLAIAGLFWYLGQNKPPVPARPPVNAQAIPTAPPAPAVSAADSVPPAPAIQADQVQSANSPSIAEMMETEQPPAPAKPAPRQAKPAIEKKPAVMAKKRQTSSSDEHYAYTRAKSYSEEPVPDEPPPESAPPREAWTPPANAAPEPAKPKLAINVLGYTENPQDRFVIINMNKYKVGQRLNGGLQIKAIHPDHIVLQQGNVSFKMERP